MNVAKEKFSKKRKSNELFDQFPPPINIESSSTKKHVCKHVRNSVYKVHNNEKDFIHPPLPVRQVKNFCSEFKFKPPKVLPHRSVPPNASYLKLTKSFFGSKTFASLREKILRSQKPSSALEETCYDFAPQITSTPNTTMDKFQECELHNNPAREEPSQKVISHDEDYLKEMFGDDELAIQRISNFLTEDAIFNEGKRQIADKELVLEETSTIGTNSLINMGKTPTEDQFANDTFSNLCIKCQHSKRPGSFNLAKRVAPPIWPGYHGNIFDSATNTNASIDGIDFSTVSSPCFREDSNEVSYEDAFPQLRDINIVSGSNAPDVFSFIEKKVKSKDVCKTFKDIADVTNFNENLMQPKSKIEGSFATFWRTEAKCDPVSSPKIQKHCSNNANQMKYLSSESHKIRDKCPVCQSPYREATLNEVSEELFSPKIKYHPKPYLEVSSQRSYPNKKHREKTPKFNETEFFLENNASQNDRPNFDLLNNDKLW